MKRVCTILWVLTLGSAHAEVSKCSAHTNTLEVQPYGGEHVNHKVLLNGNTIINELADGMWFIEDVVCTAVGFTIKASHRQYGEPKAQIFSLRVTREGGYTLE